MYEDRVFTTIDELAADIADTLEAGGGPVAAEFDIDAIIQETYQYVTEWQGWVPNYVSDLDDDCDEMDVQDEASTWGEEVFWASVEDNRIFNFDARVRPVDENLPDEDREIAVIGFNDYDIDPVVEAIRLDDGQDPIKALQAGGWTVVRTNDLGSWTVRRTH